jgi:hypothetical protein
MREEAAKRIGDLYPTITMKDGNTEATVSAWLWVRTVSSPDPRAKGVRVPLASTSYTVVADVLGGWGEGELAVCFIRTYVDDNTSTTASNKSSTERVRLWISI